MSTAASIAGRDSARGRFWPWVLIALATLVTFAPICRNGFVAWDDDFTLEHNPRIVHPSWHNVAFYWRHEFMDLYVPVTYTVWSGVSWLQHVVQRSGAPDARWFHTISVLAHAINALLVFSLIRRLLRGGAWPAAAGALLYALHPVQVEAVAWTSGLKDVLCGTFVLIALNQYVCAVAPMTEAAHWAPRRRGHYAGAMIAMLLAMLCKPGAMMTPALAGTIDLLILGRSWRRVAVSVAPLLLLAVPCMVWTKLCQPGGYLHGAPPLQRPLIAADALAFYLYKLLFPVHLTYDYGRSPWMAMRSHWPYFSWQAAAAIAVVLTIYRRQARVLIAACGLSVFALLPVLGLTPFDFQTISTVADHYMYVAMLGPAIAVAWVLEARRHERADGQRTPTLPSPGIPGEGMRFGFPAGGKRRGWLAAGTTIALGLLALRATDQTRFWHDSRTFFAHALEVNPQSWSSFHALGYLCHEEGRALAIQAAKKEALGQKTEERAAANDLLLAAMDYYHQALVLNPNSPAAAHGYGAMLLYFQRFDDAARAFREVLRLRQTMRPSAQSKYYADSDLLGQALLAGGHPDEAVRAFIEATHLRPPPPDAAEHLRQAQAALAAARASAEHTTVTDTHEAAEH